MSDDKKAAKRAREAARRRERRQTDPAFAALERERNRLWQERHRARKRINQREWAARKRAAARGVVIAPVEEQYVPPPIPPLTWWGAVA